MKGVTGHSGAACRPAKHLLFGFVAVVVLGLGVGNFALQPPRNEPGKPGELSSPQGRSPKRVLQAAPGDGGYVYRLPRGTPVPAGAKIIETYKNFQWVLVSEKAQPSASVLSFRISSFAFSRKNRTARAGVG